MTFNFETMTSKQVTNVQIGTSPRKVTRKPRIILGDVQPNLNCTKTVTSKPVIRMVEKNTTNAPRRSGRLLVAREAAAESKQATEKSEAFVEAKVSYQETKRTRAKSAPSDMNPIEPTNSISAFPSTESGLVQQIKRPRSVQEIPPPHLQVPRISSRRLSDEFDDNVPTKRARHHISLIINHKKRDGRPQEHHNLSLTNFESTKYTAGFSPYDASIRGDVLQSPEYVSDIFQRLYHSEALNAPTCYMQNQNCITASMRSILIDWIVDVHLKFRCVPETLHLAVNIIDRYLSTVEVTRDVLQLVGITALLLASKYEEIYPPEVKNCVMICQRAYNVQQVLDMEADMLGELSFNLTVPTGHPFLHRFLFITHATETMSIAANYYTERMLQEHDSLKYRPSMIAAAAVCLAINHPEIRDHDEIETTKPGVPQTLVDYTGYTPEMILDAADFVASKVGESVKTKANRCLVAVQRKYSYNRYRHVSTLFEAPDAVDILDDSS